LEEIFFCGGEGKKKIGEGGKKCGMNTTKPSTLNDS
jgi:hypothetical protein